MKSIKLTGTLENQTLAELRLINHSQLARSFASTLNVTPWRSPETCLVQGPIAITIWRRQFQDE
jgi:hypothetical protein